jgi:hypothetical protein
LKKLSIFLFFVLIIFSCGKDKISDINGDSDQISTITPKIITEFGYTLNNYRVIKDTIKKGESFGIILDRHHVF